MVNFIGDEQYAHMLRMVDALVNSEEEIREGREDEEEARLDDIKIRYYDMSDSEESEEDLSSGDDVNYNLFWLMPADIYEVPNDGSQCSNEASEELD